jgi:hypothetical protein
MQTCALLIPLLLGVAATTFAADGPATAGRLVSVTDGEDWSLPSDVRPTPGCGIGWVDGQWIAKWSKLYPLHQADPDIIHFNQWIEVRWADVNPARGVFDWSSVDRQIERIEETPHLGFAFWLKGYARCEERSTGTFEAKYRMVPRWLEDQGKVTFLPDGTAVSWDPDSGYLRAYGEFLRAVAQRYADHPRFCWVECRFIDRAWGEGGFRGGSVPEDDAPDDEEKQQELRDHVEVEFRSAERDHKMSPENLDRFLHAFYDLHAEAFKGHERAVVLPDFSECLFGGFQYDRERYAPVCRRAWQYGLEKGFGGRDGFVEVWMLYLTEGWGISFDENGYMRLNEDHPAIREGRVWNTENEEYPPHVSAHRFGPLEMTGYRYRAANLRALQMRRNWVSVSTWNNQPLVQSDLTRYVQLSVGKTAATSPDAWSWLREAYVWGGNIDPAILGEKTAKNFERWLFQRDVGPDGRTQPAARVSIEGMNQFWSSRPYEYQARRTDTASGQDSIYFQADEAWFGDEPRDARLFIGFQAAGEGSWCVEYDTETARRRSPVVAVGAGDGWRTAVLELPGMVCRRGFADRMDFRVLHLDGADTVVRMARLVKWPEDR